MKLATLADVKAKFSDYVKECEKQTVVVTKNGRPTAALIPIDSDEDLESILLDESKVVQRILARSKASISTGKGVAEDEFWQGLKGKTKRTRKPPRHAG